MATKKTKKEDVDMKAFQQRGFTKPQGFKNPLSK